LKQVFTTALQSYLTELDKVTLADITRATRVNLRRGSHGVSMVAVSKIGRPGSIELPVKKKPAEKTAIQSKATRSTSSTRA
jgi:hypothetical protein